MNPWYMLGGYLLLEIAFIITMIVSLVKIVIYSKKKIASKKPKVHFGLAIILFIGLNIFIMSHGTYYKYNDWWVEQNNIVNVMERYGEFDLGTYVDGKTGRVGYYIYTDNGPIMPDYLKHYYYIEYDVWGVVYNVYDGVQPGG